MYWRGESKEAHVCSAPIKIPLYEFGKKALRDEEELIKIPCFKPSHFAKRR